MPVSRNRNKKKRSKKDRFTGASKKYSQAFHFMKKAESEKNSELLPEQNHVLENSPEVVDANKVQRSPK